MAKPPPNNAPSDHEPYPLIQPDVVAPALPGGDVEVAGTVDELIDVAAADLVVHAENCVRKFGDFHIALSGGSSPEPFYQRLMYDPNYRRLPWRRTHLWVVDERCVPFDHPASNWRMIRDTIADHADIPREQVHPINATSPSGDVEYERALGDTLGWREKGQDRLDYVLLGMGGDNHTASLFPNTAPLHETGRLVVMNRAPVAPHERITMTFPLINASRLIAVFITGEGKAAAVKRIASARLSVDEAPILGIKPLNGELKWYLDGPACGATGRVG